MKSTIGTKVIVIEASNGTVRIGFASALKDLQKLVGGYICLATTLANGDEVFVDDEGILKEYPYGFTITGAHQPFFGNGYVIGPADDEGGDTDAQSTVDEIARMVHFWRA
jgi:hypothetical protein